MGYSGNLYAQATEVITSQGDLRRGDSSGNPERLAIGSSGKVLQSNGTTESWETPASASVTTTTLNVYLTSDFSTTENTATILTGMTFDLPTISGGKCLIAFSNVCFRSSAGGIQNYIATDTSGSDVAIAGTGRGAENPSATVASYPLWNMGTQAIHDADGSSISIFCWTGGGTLTYKGDNTSNKTTSMSALCVG